MKNMKSINVRCIGIVLLALSIIGIGIWPLLQRGFIPTHDGEYSIIRFMEFNRMLGEGVLFPKWAPTVNSGYGLPVFIFYYPFTNYIGALFHVFGSSIVDSVKLTLALGYICSFVFCFLWLKSMFGSVKASLSGSIIGAFVPYWFVELYVRGSVPEVWALAFVFSCLWGISKKNPLLIAGSVCLLILSHNILALIFMPFLIGFSILHDKKTLQWFLLGIGMASYFFIPALFERQYVVGLNTVSYKDHFVRLYQLLIPSWGTDFSGAGGAFGNSMSLQIGIVPLFILFSLCVFLIKDKTRGFFQKYIAYFLVCSITAIVCMFSFSDVLWKYVPLLSYVQYPWRFLTYIIPVAAFGSAYLVSRGKRIWVAVVLVIVTVLFSYPYTKPVLYEPRSDQYYASRKNFTDGTVSMGNSFSTIWTSWKQERAKGTIEVENGMLVSWEEDRYMTKIFTIESFSQKTDVSLPILYYPGWVVEEGGAPVPIEYEKDGTIRFSLSGEGIHHVRVFFGSTYVRTIASCISVFCFGVLLFICVNNRTRKNKKKKNSSYRRQRHTV